MRSFTIAEREALAPLQFSYCGQPGWPTLRLNVSKSCLRTSPVVQGGPRFFSSQLFTDFSEAAILSQTRAQGGQRLARLNGDNLKLVFYFLVAYVDVLGAGDLVEQDSAF